MNILRGIFGVAVWVAYGAQVHAADLECEKGCFADQRSCTAQAEVILAHQDCSKEQVACRMGCSSGKQMKAYRDLGDLNYNFRPLAKELL